MKQLWYLLLSVFFLEIPHALAQDRGPITQRVTNPLSCPDLGCVVTKIIHGLFILAIPVVTIMVLVGGFQIMTAGGDPEKLKNGKKTVLYAAIGFIVIGLAESVAYIIQNAFQ